jgi:hypothetical protein
MSEQPLTATAIRMANEHYWATHPKWIDLTPWLKPFVDLVFKILARRDEGGWPTRENGGDDLC